MALYTPDSDPTLLRAPTTEPSPQEGFPVQAQALILLALASTSLAAAHRACVSFAWKTVNLAFTSPVGGTYLARSCGPSLKRF